jgi:hypothetical protein
MSTNDQDNDDVHTPPPHASSSSSQVNDEIMQDATINAINEEGRQDPTPGGESSNSAELSAPRSKRSHSGSSYSTASRNVRKHVRLDQSRAVSVATTRAAHPGFRMTDDDDIMSLDTEQGPERMQQPTATETPAFGSSPVRVNPHDGLPAPLGDNIPELMYKIIPVEEREALNQVMLTKGHQAPNWPKEEFARIYLINGCHELLRRYCRMILQTESVKDQLVLSQKLIGGQRNAFLEEEQEEQVEKLRRQDKKRQQLGFAEYETPWNQVEDELPRDIDITAVFSDIDSKRSKELLDGIEKYPWNSREEELGDYLSWIKRIQGDLDAQPTYRANFILLRKVGSVYAAEILKLYRFNLRTMATETLVRKVGTLVYKRQGKDPVLLASTIRRKDYGCIARQDLYQRVVDLHYCRSDYISEHEFVIELLTSVAMKIPHRFRESYYRDVFEYYGSINDRMQGNASSRLVSILPTGVSHKLEQGLLFPTGAKAIREYANFLVYMAGRLNVAQLESNYVKHCATPDDPEYGLLQRNAKRPERTEKSTKKEVKTASTPRRDGAAAGKEQLTPARGKKSESKASGNEQTPGRGSGSARSERYCENCRSNTHTDETCWTLHPEQKEEFEKRRKEFREARNARWKRRNASEKGKASDVEKTPQKGQINEIKVKSDKSGEGDFQ